MILSSPLLDCSFYPPSSLRPHSLQGCRIVPLCLSFSRSLTRAGSSPWWIWCVFCATSPPSKRSECVAFCVPCVLRVRAGLRWTKRRRPSRLLQALPPRCRRLQVIPSRTRSRIRSPRRRRSTRVSAKIAVPSGPPSPSTISMVGVSPSVLRVGIKRIMRRSTSLIVPAGVESPFMVRGAPSVAGAFVSSRILPMSRSRCRCRLRGGAEEGVGLFTWGGSHSQNQTEFKSHSQCRREVELKIFQEGGNCANGSQIQSGFVSTRMCAWESKRPDPPRQFVFVPHVGGEPGAHRSSRRDPHGDAQRHSAPQFTRLRERLLDTLGGTQTHESGQHESVFKRSGRRTLRG
jgi:hypothetical protein